jgi:hypothetical protein
MTFTLFFIYGDISLFQIFCCPIYALLPTLVSPQYTPGVSIAEVVIPLTSFSHLTIFAAACGDSENHNQYIHLPIFSNHLPNI